jgi:hypothetical protein
MNLITEPLRALMRRKLWPVALLLVGALVAVPVLLTKQPEDTSFAAVATPAAGKDDGMPATFVSAAEPADDADATAVKRRRTLGAEKDPFEPAPLPKRKHKKAAAKATKKPATAAEATTSKPDTKPTPPSTSGATTAPPAPVVATPTPAPKTIIPAGSLQVRFGTVDQDPLPARILKKSTPLPSADEPAFVYDGLDSDHRAVFMITGEVTVEGDGKCLPTPENCETLKLKAGETEFLTVAAGEGNSSSVQYELDVLKVHTTPFAVAAKAH